VEAFILWLLTLNLDNFRFMEVDFVAKGGLHFVHFYGFREFRFFRPTVILLRAACAL